MIPMRHLTRAIALFIILISTPLFASAATAAELTAQAESLLQQIAALQAQIAAQSGGTTAPSTTVTSSNCPLIGRVLKLGSSGDDVSRLQRFLASDPAIYPEAMVTGYYGTLTENAVKRWQVKYNIVSSGDAASTGYGVTGPRTAAAISLQCSGSSTVGGSNVTSPVVGGFIQVTPVSGNAPLTVRVTATVNTVNSCLPSTYTLDWGDGTIPQTIPVSSGVCGSVQQIYSHMYVYGGNYLVRLSAGEHSTTATVQVFGASAGSIGTPSSPTLPASISVSAPSGGQTFQAGNTTNVTWSAGGNIPSNSQVELDIINSSGQRVGNPIHATANMAGTYQWQVPTGLAGGQYKIRAYILAPGGQSVTYGDSGAFTVTAPFEYGPLAVTPNISGNPLGVGASFNIPTSCTGYTLSWGDGTTSAVQAHGTSCAQTPVTRAFTHEYASTGSYTITLKRGADLSRVDTASIVISD